MGQKDHWSGHVLVMSQLQQMHVVCVWTSEL